MIILHTVATFLSKKLVDESNYYQWKTNLYLVLELENSKFVLTMPKPLEPAATASEEIKTQYADWQRANTVARCYILASVVDHLQRQMSCLETGAEMIQTLDGMFSSLARESAIRALKFTRMTEGNVREHCLAMLSHISCVEMMGLKLKQEMQIDMILKSLPDSFNEFKIIYSLNKLKFTPIELMHELESAEKYLMKPRNVYYAQSSYKPKGQPKGNNKNKNKKGVGPAVKSAATKKSTSKCFKCGQKGHWKKNCPKSVLIKQRSQ